MNMPATEALYYEKLDSDRVRCRLCPHHCLIKPGQSGICRVRVNENGRLYTQIYGEIASLALDPLEKKPLYHFYPGKQILSAGTWGCNFSCSYCQNYQLAHEKAATDTILPEQLLEIALQAQIRDSIGIAFTYNEPTIWFEYVLDTAKLMKSKGLKTVLVTNGFIDPEPLAELIPFIDAANVDIKAFTEEFYRHNCKGRLQEVKENVAFMAGKIHVEITNLIIPQENDQPEETAALAAWIAGIDPLIPLHLSRYHPAYKMERPATELAVMLRAQKECRQYLPFVFLGNLPGMINNTNCLECGEPLIIRNDYRVEVVGIEAGSCEHCGAATAYIQGS